VSALVPHIFDIVCFYDFMFTCFVWHCRPCSNIITVFLLWLFYDVIIAAVLCFALLCAMLRQIIIAPVYGGGIKAML